MRQSAVAVVRCSRSLAFSVSGFLFSLSLFLSLSFSFSLSLILLSRAGARPRAPSEAPGSAGEAEAARNKRAAVATVCVCECAPNAWRCGTLWRGAAEVDGDGTDLLPGIAGVHWCPCLRLACLGKPGADKPERKAGGWPARSSSAAMLIEHLSDLSHGCA